MYKQLTKIDFNCFFSFNVNKRTRGHSLSINTKHANNNYRLHFFTISAIKFWNKFPQKVVDAPNLSIFKVLLYPYLSQFCTITGSSS